MNPTLQVLICLLIVALIAISVKLFMVLTDLQKTITSTQRDIDKTITRVDTILDSAEVLLRDELTPTIKVARETLMNVEITTRAIADTTVAARQIVARLEGVIEPKHLATAGTAVATFIAKKTAGAASGMLSGLFSGISAGVKMVMHRRSTKKKEDERAENIPRLPPAAARNGNSVVIAETKAVHKSVKRP